MAAVAQRIARWTSNSKVVGSSPIGGAFPMAVGSDLIVRQITISNMQKLPLCKLVDKEALLDGDLAQMGGLARSPNIRSRI